MPVDRKVNSVNEATTVYDRMTTSISENDLNKKLDVSVFPNPSSDLLAVQFNGLVDQQYSVELLDLTGKQVSSSSIRPGRTIAYIDLQTVYSGTYLVKISNASSSLVKQVVLAR